MLSHTPRTLGARRPAASHPNPSPLDLSPSHRWLCSTDAQSDAQSPVKDRTRTFIIHTISNSNISSSEIFHRGFHPDSIYSFSCVSSTDFLKLSHFAEAEGLPLRISWYPDKKSVTITMTCPLHDALTALSSTTYMTMVNTNFIPAKPRIMVHASATKLPTGHYVHPLHANKRAAKNKIGDCTWTVSGRLAPSIVWESGWTESLEDIRLDAKQFLTKGGGRVKLVIIAKANEHVTVELESKEGIRANEIAKAEQSDMAMEGDHDTNVSPISDPPSDMSDYENYFNSLVIDDWVGMITVDMEFWRYNPISREAYCERTYNISLNANNDIPAINLSDIFPEAGEDRSFPIDIEAYIEYLANARRKYALWRLLEHRKRLKEAGEGKMAGDPSYIPEL